MFYRLPALLTACLALSGVAHAAPPAPAQGIVAQIEIDGNRRIEDATVLSVMRLHAGSALDATVARSDVKAIYGTGFFNDVQLDLQDRDGKQVLVVHVDEKPAVADVRLEGNKKVDEEDIREVLDIRTFAVLNDADVKKNVEHIRDLYVEKGYFLVDVQTEVQVVGVDQVELVFHIEENRKVLVQRVDITGNENVPSSRIKRFMKTKEGGAVPWLTSRGTFKREDLDMDTETIRYVLLDEGFVDASVDAPKVYLSPDKRFIYVAIHVNEGPRYEVSGVDVVGDFVPEEGLTHAVATEVVNGALVMDIQEQQWREATGRKLRRGPARERAAAVKVGDTFKLTTLQAVVQNLTDLYGDKGYAFANVVPLPYPNPETKQVEIQFQVDKGDKVRLGRIEITGNDPTLDKVVRREILVNEGELYRGSLIRASRARLQRLGYFDKVDISTPRGDAPDELDLKVKVSEQPTGSFSAGLGYSNLERITLTGNISKNNFLGLGYTMSGAVNWSKLRRQWNASLFDPYFLDSRWTLKLDGYNITQKYQLDEFQRGATIAIGRYLDQRDDTRLTLEYTLENVGLTSLDPFKSHILGGDLYRNGLTSSLGVNLNVDKRNNRIQATKGFFASASVKLAGGFRTSPDTVVSVFGGDFNFVEAKGNLRFYQPLIPNRDWLVFRLNSTMGGIWTTDGSVLPYIHRFRAGGINSVRGYDWFSLGPSLRSPSTDDPAAGDSRLVVGGTETWINNLEIQSPIVKSAGIAGVVFFDAGNAFGDPWGQGHISPAGLRLAYGAGIRWQSPMGPLRFEYGIPINPVEGERKSVFDFSIGSFF